MSRRMLLLAPSRGLGGGIERVADLVEACWEGEVDRVDVYGPAEARTRAGRARAKAGFAGRACLVARRRRPALVLAIHVGLLPVARTAALIAGGRPALVTHGREVWRRMGRLRRGLVRTTPQLIANSPFTAHVVAERAGLPEAAVSVVLLPVAHTFVAAANERASPGVGTTDGAFSIITVSRISRGSRYKGHFLVADAVASLAAEGEAPVWTVVGDGDDYPTLRAHCDRLGIAEHVDFRGRVDDEELAAIYRTADALVLPSRADPDADPPVGEGFGLVYAEAGAYGVPSIACREGGGSLAFISDGETGLTVRFTAEGVRSAIVRLMEDQALRRRLGDGARRRVLERHLPSHFAADLAQALEVPRGD